MNLADLRNFLEQALRSADDTVVALVTAVHANIILVKTRNGRCFEIELREIMESKATSTPTAD